LKTLDHPNILRFHHAFVENEKFVMIMELAKGGDLKDYMKKNGVI